jgi:hypothetical protein
MPVRHIHFWVLVPASFAFSVLIASPKQGSLFAIRSAGSGMHIKSGVTPIPRAENACEALPLYNVNRFTLTVDDSP